MNIIEDLYCDNIASRKVTDEEKRIVALIAKNEENLTRDFTEKQKETFEKFCDCFDDLNELCQREAFIQGFVMGAGIIIDVIRNIN